jgi:hypothetical protein
MTGLFVHFPRGGVRGILSVFNAAADRHPCQFPIVGITNLDQKRPAMGVDEHDSGCATLPAVVIHEATADRQLAAPSARSTPSPGRASSA